MRGALRAVADQFEVLLHDAQPTPAVGHCGVDQPRGRGAAFELVALLFQRPNELESEVQAGERGEHQEGGADRSPGQRDDVAQPRRRRLAEPERGNQQATDGAGQQPAVVS